MPKAPRPSLPGVGCDAPPSGVPGEAGRSPWAGRHRPLGTAPSEVAWVRLKPAWCGVGTDCARSLERSFSRKGWDSCSRRAGTDWQPPCFRDCLHLERKLLCSRKLGCHFAFLSLRSLAVKEGLCLPVTYVI